MNDLTELKNTLSQHADTIHDHELAGRPADVRARVRRARNQRRGVAAGVAAAAVAAASLGVWAIGPSDTDLEPAAPPEVADVQAPATLTSLGYTYEFDRSVDAPEGEDAVLRIPASDRAQLVAWATSTDVQDVSITHSPIDNHPVVFNAPDFGDSIYLHPGEEATITARVDEGSVGLASYVLTDDRPAGVSQGGITFRQEHTGHSLIAAEFGEPGSSRVELTLDDSYFPGRIGFAITCTGAEKNHWIHVSRGDRGAFSTSGCPTDFDAGQILASSKWGRARTNTFALTVTEGRKGPQVEDPVLQVGLAAYTVPRNQTSEEGLPYVLEHDGHTWRLTSGSSTVGTEIGEISVPRRPGPQLAYFGVKGISGGEGVYWLEGDGQTIASGISARGSAYGRLSADLRSVSVTGLKSNDPARLIVGFYEQVD